MFKDNRYILKIFDTELLENGKVPETANLVETRYYKTLMEFRNDFDASRDVALQVLHKFYLGDRIRVRKENKWRNFLLDKII
jgi:hypothetical protein